MNGTQTLTLNGILFAPTKKSMVDTLFTGPVTASGFYRVNANGIMLYNAKGERIGGINKHGVMYRSTAINGKLWHQAAVPSGIPEYDRYSQRCIEAEDAIRLLAR